MHLLLPLLLLILTPPVRAVDFAQRYTLSNVNQINGKDCEKWNIATDTSDKQICFDPASDTTQCNLELPQFKPPKSPDEKITNLILEFDYIPDTAKCTSRCGIKHSILIYLKGSRPEQLSDFVRGTKPRTVKRIYSFENPDNINGVYFRMTPVDFCGKIRNVKLYIGKMACKSTQLGLTKFPNLLADEAKQQKTVTGECVRNAITASLGTQPSAECDAQSGVYTVKSGCVCNAGHQKAESKCIVCPDGYYKTSPSNTPCLKCGSKSISHYNFTQCQCLAGYHRDENVGELGELSAQDCVEKEGGSADFCPSEIISHQNITQYMFPKTVHGQTITLPCGPKYEGMVTLDCVFDGLSRKAFWMSLVWSCQRILPKTIKELSEITVTSENMVLISRTLTNITSNQTIFNTSSDVVKVTTLMKECLNTGADSTKDVDQKKEVVMNVLTTLDNILHLNSTTLSTPTNNKQILDVIATVAENSLDDPVSYVGPKFTFASTPVSNKRDLNAIIASGSNPTESACNSKIMKVEFVETVANSNKEKVTKSNMAQILIPKSILQDRNITATNMIVHAFREDTIFPQQGESEVTANHVENTRPIQKVTSLIMATSLYNETITNTKEEIEITFRLKTMEEAKNAMCVFWHENKDSESPGFWSSNGCYKSDIITTEDNEIYVLCSCNHLTNFAVLFNVYAPKVGAIKSHPALNIISFIGCVISMVSLIATLVCYLGLRDIRRRTARKILINFCFSLLFLLTTFMFGIEQNARLHVCHAVSALIHLFTLSTFFWMSVQAVFLYKKAVRATKNRGESAIAYRVSFCIAWGVPIAIAGITFYFTIPQFHQNDEPISFCVIGGTVFNYVVLIPVSFCVLFNFSIFIPVTRKIHNHMTRHAHLQKDFEITLWKRAKVTLSCTTLLGLTWVFGYLSIGDLREVFQWLFCITNSLQGFFIFLFYVLLNESLVKAWKKIILPNSKTSSNNSEQSRSLMFPWSFKRNGTMTYSMKEKHNSVNGGGGRSSATLVACKNAPDRLDSLLG